VAVAAEVADRLWWRWPAEPSGSQPAQAAVAGSIYPPSAPAPRRRDQAIIHHRVQGTSCLLGVRAGGCCCCCLLWLLLLLLMEAGHCCCCALPACCAAGLAGWLVPRDADRERPLECPTNEQLEVFWSLLLCASALQLYSCTVVLRL
jgi:hypothetical protein